MTRSVILTICLFTASAAFAQAPNQAQNQVTVKKTKTGPGPKSTAEQQAVQAVIQAKAPDDVAKAVDNLITKFPTTDFKSWALELEGEAYENNKDYAKAIVYGEQSLEADPKNFFADTLLANVMAATTRDTDLDKDEKLTKADKYAHDGLEALNGDKPWMYPDDKQWTAVKAIATGQAYQALGTIALVRKKNDDAIEDFQKGVEASNDPLLMLRLGRALYTAKKYDEAISWDDKVIATDSPYKNIAQSDKQRAELAKGGK